ncbi:hypothetical protein PIB30_099098 [Stylosanthes scabra]|uniref:Uncharacterized protein n=1 Tax=Stylosanthes scabra TaxID=79078 RepID=A0ABU6UZD1_9FABA|nr:hypothetical protein [Stylosanthes scabra]
MMCHMGADGDPSVAAVPVGELSGEAMALARSGRTDHRAAVGGVKAVTHSDNTVVEVTVLGRPHELSDGGDGMMCHMGADGDPSVAAVPVGELSGEAMALARSGRTDHRAAVGGVKAVMHSDNTVVEVTVYDS